MLKVAMSTNEDTPSSETGLRAGTGSLSREEVVDIQRARILSAMVQVAAEHGYIGAAIAPVVARAGVSRRTFYELFEGREDCFLAAFEWGVAQAREVMVEAYGTKRSWREGVRHALAALLTLLDCEPELARVCVIEALGAGRLVLARRAQVMDELIAALDASAPRARGSSVPLLRADGVIGGAFSVLHGRLLEQGHAQGSSGTAAHKPSSDASGSLAAAAHKPSSDPSGSPTAGVGSLIQLHGQLMALIALPYLGPRAAGEELTRAAPEVPAPSKLGVGAGGGRLLERLDMRLTYRTVRCLLFIGEHSGASNREVARGADIPDEGQASKLLTRLMRLGLVANTRQHGPGYPNYWTLTPHGDQVLSAVQGR
jgi:AcrR family transcriptional regulator